MKNQSFILVIVLSLVGLFLLTGCGPATPPSAASEVEPAADEAEEHQEAMDEHHEEADEHHEEMAEGGHMAGMNHIHAQVPHEFEDLTNPYSGDNEALEAGQTIFQTNCATCHGPEGQGDGPAAVGLDPKPATLADGMMMGDLSDGYLYWRVSQGGAMEPFNSAMPAWGESLSEEQIWQVISYVRTLSQ